MKTKNCLYVNSLESSFLKPFSVRKNSIDHTESTRKSIYSLRSLDFILKLTSYLMDDGVIRMYIDEVFQVYDYDRSGTLEFKEVDNFFNELYASLNEQRRFT